jgi:ubiquitin-protein ligase
MSFRKLAIKRITNDLKEITNCPLDGIGIASLDNDPMKYVVNIQLMMGLYEGYCIQLLMTFSDYYPTKPPKILIYPNQTIDGTYHHHIFEDYDNSIYNRNLGIFKGFCFDFLENNFMSTSEEHSGWNPGYTISSILLQVQNFLSDPDLPKERLPNKEKIDYLKKSMDNYQRTFTIKEANGEKQIIHTWKDPYPKMHFNYTKMGYDENSIKTSEENVDYKRMNELKGNLTCFMLKNNYIDNPEILLGYPIVQNKNVLGKNKIELYPIPELLSYEAFNVQKEQQNAKLLNEYFDTNLKAANNEFYNFWLPIYINRDHYEKNKTTIIESLKIIKKENVFKPEQIFEILPIILNKMIIGMFNGKSYISSSFIQCYFQYVLLFKKLIQEYEGDFIKYSTKKIDLITKNDYDINKNIIPDIGNFMMLMFYANTELIKPEEKKKIWYTLFEEFFIRQMYWLFHGDECKNKMKNLIMKNNVNDSKILDQVYLDKFEYDPDFKMRYLDIFNKQLHKLGIFDEIVDIISNDENILFEYYGDRNYTKNMVIKRMTQSFKRLFNECYQHNRDKLKKIILEKMNFSIFFERELNEIKEDIYNGMKIEELLKDENIKNMDEISEYAFESQRGNKLLLITFFAQKKIEEKDFMENLEKNYGVFLEIDHFVKEMKNKLNEIKSFKELYKYIGSEFGQDKSERDLLIEGYKRAKQKGYIRDNKVEKNKNNYNNYNGVFKGRYNNRGNNYIYGNNMYRQNNRGKNPYGYGFGMNMYQNGGGY